ncbi:MAG TPA: hypothetical protein VGB35_06620 [Gammaproteobacteria bacterium]
MAEEHRSDVKNGDRASALEGALAAARQEPGEMQLRREARRRILAGGLAGAPLVLTLTSRSAFASHCTYSGMMSGNLSSGHEVVCEGRTPGFWKTHENQVLQYVYPGTCNPITEDGGQCEDYSIPEAEELAAYIEELKTDEHKNAWRITRAAEYLENLENYPEPSSFFGTLFSEKFGDGYTENPNTTIMQALWLDDTPPLPPEGLGGPSPVLAHSAAAWLNANEFKKEGYGLSPEEVVALVQRLMRTDPITLKDTLEMLNSRS